MQLCWIDKTFYHTFNHSLTPIEYYETGNKLEWVLEMNGHVWTSTKVFVVHEIIVPALDEWLLYWKWTVIEILHKGKGKLFCP
jgi:hypothetical protein